MADWGLLAIRFALYADLVLLAGLSAFPLYSLTPTEREGNAILPLDGPLKLLAILGLLLSGTGFLVSSAAMMGIPIGDLDSAMLVTMASETDVGIALMVRLAVLAAVAAGLFVIKQSQSGKFTLSLAGGSIALATLIWSGHAGATEGAFGAAHRISGIAHLIAAALWIGGITAFALLLRSRAQASDAAHISLVARALARFAPVGTASVAIIVLTGLVNGYAIFGSNVAALVGSTYGMLLTFKVGLVGIMLVLAANNRWRLTPALERAGGDGIAAAWIGLRRSVALEAVAGVGILILVAWLGMIDPGGG